jgi:hypothetical protein
VGFLAERVALGQVFWEGFGFTCQVNCSTLIYRQELVQYAKYWLTYRVDSSLNPQNHARKINACKETGYEGKVRSIAKFKIHGTKVALRDD